MSTLTFPHLLALTSSPSSFPSSSLADIRHPSDESGAIGAAAALSHALNSDEVTKAAYLDMQKLAATVVEIRGKFAFIGAMLTMWDVWSAGKRDVHGNEVSLWPGWEPLCKEFDEAWKASVQIAPAALDSMKTVHDILGPTSTQTTGDLKKRLRAFMTVVQEKEKDALQIKNRFQALVDNVRVFWARVQDALTIPVLDENRRQVLASTSKRLEELTTQMSELQKKLATLQTTTIAQISAGGSAALMTLLTMCPDAFLASLEKAFKSGDGSSVFSDIKRQLQVVHDEIASTKRKIGETVQGTEAEELYQEIIGNPKGWMDSIAMQLDAIVNIWQTMNLDFHALYESISLTADDDQPLTKFMLSKMKVTKDIYTKLEWMLETYIDQMKAVPP